MNRTIVVEKREDFFVAKCLEIPEASSKGATEEEAITNTKKALEALELFKDCC